MLVLPVPLLRLCFEVAKKDDAASQLQEMPRQFCCLCNGHCFKGFSVELMGGGDLLGPF